MTEKIIMTAGDIERSLDRIALEIVERNRGLDELSIIGIHTGGVFVAEQLKRRMEARGKGMRLPSGNLDIWWTTCSSPAAPSAPPWTPSWITGGLWASSSRCWWIAAAASCPSSRTTWA